MAWAAAAPYLITGGISLISSLFSGMSGSSSASKAANAQENASKAATNAQLYEYYMNRKDQAPWRQAGTWAIGNQGGYYDNKGEFVSAEAPTDDELRRLASKRLKLFAGQPGYDNAVSALAEKLRGTLQYKESSGLVDKLDKGPGEYKESPYYNFLADETNKSIARSASATGKLGSGAAIKEAQRYGMNLASTDYNNWINQWLNTEINPLLSVAGLGQTSVNQTGQVGMNAANNIGAYATNAGNARASGYINSANAVTGALNSVTQGANNAMDNYLFYNYLTERDKKE